MKQSFFKTNIYIEENISWLDNLNKFTDSYVKEAIENIVKNIL